MQLNYNQPRGTTDPATTFSTPASGYNPSPPPNFVSISFLSLQVYSYTMQGPLHGIQVHAPVASTSFLSIFYHFFLPHFLLLLLFSPLSSSSTSFFLPSSTPSFFLCSFYPFFSPCVASTLSFPHHHTALAPSVALLLHLLFFARGTARSSHFPPLFLFLFPTSSPLYPVLRLAWDWCLSPVPVRPHLRPLPCAWLRGGFTIVSFVFFRFLRILSFLSCPSFPSSFPFCGVLDNVTKRPPFRS